VARPYYLAAVGLGAAIVGMDVLLVHVQVGHGWLLRDRTASICFDRNCSIDSLNVQALLLAPLPTLALPSPLDAISSPAPTKRLAMFCKWMIVLAAAGLLAYSVEVATRLHRPRFSLGGVAFSPNGVAEVIGLVGIALVILSGLVMRVFHIPRRGIAGGGRPDGGGPTAG
jgi:hypothetical protein